MLVAIEVVGCANIKTSNGNFNSLPTAATHWGKYLSLIRVLFQVYCDLFMVFRMET